MNLEKLKDTARKFEQKEDWRRAGVNTFIREVGDRKKATQIIRSIIDFGHGLDMHVVVEGIESDWQARQASDHRKPRNQPAMFVRIIVNNIAKVGLDNPAAVRGWGARVK